MAVQSVEYFLEEIKSAAKRGLLCSQMIIDIGLRELGLSSPDLVKGAGALVGAIGFQGVTCGALTGAGCLIVYAGVDKLERSVYLLIEELESRFKDLASDYPGLHCSDILDYDPAKIPTEVCFPLIAGSIHIALDLLDKAGIRKDVTV
ncbi:MAG: C-GCAxxG-C-C family protein [Pseudomonadota bacterium]